MRRWLFIARWMVVWAVSCIVNQIRIIIKMCLKLPRDILDGYYLAQWEWEYINRKEVST